MGLHCYAVSTHPDELVLEPPPLKKSWIRLWVTHTNREIQTSVFIWSIKVTFVRKVAIFHFVLHVIWFSRKRWKRMYFNFARTWRWQIRIWNRCWTMASCTHCGNNHGKTFFQLLISSTPNSSIIVYLKLLLLFNPFYGDIGCFFCL